MVWDADEQRLQLTEEVGYDRWQFVYDTAAGIPAALVQRKADMDNETLGVTFHVREPGGELLASFESGGAVRYYHFDALGSTVLLSDGSGNATSAYAYGAWGDVLASPASWQPYQYVGQLGYYTHTTSQGAEIADWLQLGVRFYQPEIGRFTQRDPLNTAQSRYLYAYANPWVFVDPSGRTNRRSLPTRIYLDSSCDKLRDKLRGYVYFDPEDETQPVKKLDPKKDESEPIDNVYWFDPERNKWYGARTPNGCRVWITCNAKEKKWFRVHWSCGCIGTIKGGGVKPGQPVPVLPDPRQGGQMK